jgi:8-oxo-dGTP diphosphatase
VSGGPLSAPVPAAGVVCLRGPEDFREVLLIRRGQPPRLGEWSLPGGRIEFGERAEDAALRELFEETGVTAELAGLVDVVDGLFGDRHYVLIDYVARWVAGEPVAGDDAAEARFMPLHEALAVVEWHETRRIILEAHAALAAPPTGHG